MSSFALKILGVLALIVDLVGTPISPRRSSPDYPAGSPPILPFDCGGLSQNLQSAKVLPLPPADFRLLAEMPYDLFLFRRTGGSKSQNLLFYHGVGICGPVPLCLQKDRSSGTMMLLLLCAMVATILKTQYSLFGVMLIFSSTPWATSLRSWRSPSAWWPWP